MTNLSAH